MFAQVREQILVADGAIQLDDGVEHVPEIPQGIPAPVSPAGSSAPPGPRMWISPTAIRSRRPLCSSHSSPVITVAAWPSVAAYNSHKPGHEHCWFPVKSPRTAVRKGAL